MGCALIGQLGSLLGVSCLFARSCVGGVCSDSISVVLIDCGDFNEHIFVFLAEFGGVNVPKKEKEPSTLEDLAVAARGGMETLRPALQRVYMTRASAYGDALKSFIEGYEEGVQQVMDKKEDSKSQLEDDSPKKST